MFGTGSVGTGTVSTATISLTDSNSDDEDGILNARILDPSGPGTAVTTITVGSSTSG